MICHLNEQMDSHRLPWISRLKPWIQTIFQYTQLSSEAKISAHETSFEKN